MTSILYTLLGGALVVIGVLAAAVADRVRGLRITRERPQVAVANLPSRKQDGSAAAEIQHADHPAAIARTRWNVGRKPAESTAVADEVIAALVAAGYKKPIASEATWSCNAADRATIESWTAAALRRAGKGAPS
jgi:hypothetical protein